MLHWLPEVEGLVPISPTIDGEILLATRILKNLIHYLKAPQVLILTPLPPKSFWLDPSLLTSSWALDKNILGKIRFFSAMPLSQASVSLKNKIFTFLYAELHVAGLPWGWKSLGQVRSATPLIRHWTNNIKSFSLIDLHLVICKSKWPEYNRIMFGCNSQVWNRVVFHSSETEKVTVDLILNNLSCSTPPSKKK